MTQRSFLLGMEYAAGAPGTDDNVFTVDGCDIEILVRDDQGSAETTATLARELIEVDDVDLLVGTVSSGSTATLQEIALENDVVLIVAPAAANDITGVNFNDHTFRTSRENYQDSINLCEYLASEYDTFVQISPDYSFGYGGAEAFRDACTFFGGLVGNHGFGGDQQTCNRCSVFQSGTHHFGRVDHAELEHVAILLSAFQQIFIGSDQLLLGQL